MKYRALFIPVLPLFMLFAAQAIAQDENDKDYKKGAEYASEISTNDKSGDIKVPPGMELKKVGSLNLVVPAGSQMHKDRSQWIMEGPEDFAARNISEIKARLDGIEKEQEELKKSIEELKKSPKKPQ